MKSLISVNSKFMVLNPTELVNLILNSKYTKGIEIYINFENDFQQKYLNDLVFEINKNNLILQVHSDVEIEFDKQLDYMRQLEKYSDYLGYPIIVTLHTIYDENQEESIIKTRNYIGDLINNIDNKKILIALENLNNARGFNRLGKEEITNIILNDDRMFFTYDIGHEIANYGEITNVDNYLIEELRNVHIHSKDNQGRDHWPIYKNDIHWNEIIKALMYLVNNKYKYNIVYEYALEYCYGETTKERVIDYLNSIDFVSERYGYLC